MSLRDSLDLTSLLAVFVQTSEVLDDVWELDLTRGFNAGQRGTWRRLTQLPFACAYGVALFHAPTGSMYIQGGMVVTQETVPVSERLYIQLRCCTT